jgi:hypothetical protein
VVVGGVENNISSSLESREIFSLCMLLVYIKTFENYHMLHHMVKLDFHWSVTFPVQLCCQVPESVFNL